MSDGEIQMREGQITYPDMRQAELPCGTCVLIILILIVIVVL